MNSLLKMLYLTMMDVRKNGPADGRIGVIHAQLSIYFADRIPEQHLRRRKSRVKINGFFPLTSVTVGGKLLIWRQRT